MSISLELETNNKHGKYPVFTMFIICFEFPIFRHCYKRHNHMEHGKYPVLTSSDSLKINKCLIIDTLFVKIAGSRWMQ